jgi:hypothetical protein
MVKDIKLLEQRKIADRTGNICLIFLISSQDYCKFLVRIRTGNTNQLNI